MRNILETIRTNVKGDTRRLAATYLAIIMGLTLMFSAVIYFISSAQFDRPLPPRAQQNWSMNQMYGTSDLQDLISQRAAEARTELLLSLVFLNLTVLAGGAFFSYFLARKTLEPIEAAMEAQSRFVSDASHELRTPLTALQVTNEVALRKKKLTIADAKDLITHNLAETIKLKNLSEALLGLAKQESASTSQASFTLANAVNAGVESFAPLAASKHITIKHAVPNISLVANQPAVEQVLRILVDNAIKYSPNESAVTITATSDDSYVTLTVADEGPGIAHEHQAKIFNRFYRVDESRSSQHVEGSGLGLAIAKSIAERHGYGLSVQSQPGKGALFSLRIAV